MAKRPLHADISGQTEEYRKGMVLGFTMAEIMLVLLFLLLLLLGKQLQDLERQISDSIPSNSPAAIVGANLKEQFAIATESGGIPSAMSFEEWVGKLIFQSEAEQVDILKAQIKALKELLNDRDVRIEELQRDLGPLAEMRESIAALEQELSRSETERLGLEAENEALSREANKLSVFREKYGDMITAFDESGISSDEGAQCLLECGEKGVPACWGESINNPDFIYDIAMFDDFFWVAPRRDNINLNINKWNALPEKARIVSPSFLGRKQFRFRMQGLNEFGRSNDGCKFSVRLFDAATSSKDMYKSMRKEVESFAYPATRPKQNWSNGELPCDTCSPAN